MRPLFRLLQFLFFSLVKWNFVGKGEKQLSLEVGDMVFIQEACDGKNMSKYKDVFSVKMSRFVCCVLCVAYSKTKLVAFFLLFPINQLGPKR